MEQPGTIPRTLWYESGASPLSRVAFETTLVIGGFPAGAWLTAALVQTVLRLGQDVPLPPKILG